MKKEKPKVSMGIGKRKKSVARAVIVPGSGVVRINSKLLDLYEPELYREKIKEPLIIAGKYSETVDINVNVQSGGFAGQADAIRTAISNALVNYFKDESLEKTFKKYDRTLLTSDLRQKEVKKPLGRGARSKKQKSYR